MQASVRSPSCRWLDPYSSQMRGRPRAKGCKWVARAWGACGSQDPCTRMGASACITSTQDLTASLHEGNVVFIAVAFAGWHFGLFCPSRSLWVLPSARYGLAVGRTSICDRHPVLGAVSAGVVGINTARNRADAVLLLGSEVLDS